MPPLLSLPPLQPMELLPGMLLAAAVVAVSLGARLLLPWAAPGARGPGETSLRRARWHRQPWRAEDSLRAGWRAVR